MKSFRALGSIQVCWILVVFAGPARADDQVTIPKSRLEELERKESELEKLKATPKPPQETPPPPVQAQPEVVHMPAPPVPKPALTKPLPHIDSLPPLAPDETVSAIDLAEHYLANPSAADKRYRNKSFKIQGEALTFHKRLFMTPYKIVLKTAGRDIVIICEVNPPQQYKATFPANNASELDAIQLDDSKITIVKAGQKVLLGGKCKGLKGSVVEMSGCELKALGPEPKR